MPNRLPNGGRIDRTRKLRFLFNGHRYEGHPGDTLASALVANGVTLVSRSLKYHRPRGLLSAGPQEPNALFHVGFGPRSTPAMKATEVELHDGLVAVPERGWPSLGWDLGRVYDVVPGLLAAGFPYKTFNAGSGLWQRVFEPLLRGAAGWGSVPDGPDGDRYDSRWAHCDVLIVGAGPAGLAAALAAAGGRGERVILAESQNEPGGHLLHRDRAIGGHEALAWVAETVEALRRSPDVTVLTRTTVTMLEGDGSALALERRTDHLGPQIGSFVTRQRLWKIKARRVVLATGAMERPVVFPGNDRPGVMLADAVLAYIRRWAALPGREAVVMTTNDSAYETAEALLDVGAGVAAVVDLRRDPPARLIERLRERGVEVLTGYGVVGTTGRRCITGVKVQCLSPDAQGVHGPTRTIACGLLAVSGGWDPDTVLLRQAGGTLRWDAEWSCHVPADVPDFLSVAGGCAGMFNLHGSLGQGLGAFSSDPPATPSVREPEFGPPRAVWQIPGRQPAFIDLQNDTTAADIALAVREGFDHPQHLKRYAVIGLGTEQGRTSMVNALGILSEMTGRPMRDLTPTTARPPVEPVALGAIAGRALGEFAAPRRLAPPHDWHLAAGARFRDDAGWHRPEAFPLPGEGLPQAIEREVIAVRERVGLHDAAPLGKIDITGPDAGAFLDRVFTNAWSGLPVGRLRYGLMLGDDGGILDDGIGARMAPDRFRVMVGAARADTVLAHLRACRALWPELRLFVTDVTGQWAVVVLSGPRSREVLARLAPDLYLGAKAFPFMTVQEAAIAGVPGRVARVGFTGELSYELVVPWSRGLAVWQAALEAGAPFGVAPVGLGAIEVLRAEKGFILPGRETQAGTTPHDIGHARLVDMSKGPFVGRDALERGGLERGAGSGRRELVGLLTEDPRVVLPEGAALTAERDVWPPQQVIGHVTSSCHSPTLGRTIALALLAEGRGRLGHLVHAPLGHRTISAVVTEPVFFDPEGRRRDG
ncbi:2Fe-2S iron-sulfur cluster-binding protein [Novispirillum sp. DQ9]|uniref:2Fe-2S iron-sulfur cluster-binding protein n=1 Tax=Novispirillum sp. DQ9 TaxID=3398612 RepID=UPI003C7A539E